MEFRQGTASRALLVPARSLLVMSGESRLAWAHYIPHRKGDWVDGALVPRPQRRVSLTYREVGCRSMSRRPTGAISSVNGGLLWRQPAVTASPPGLRPCPTWHQQILEDAQGKIILRQSPLASTAMTPGQ